MIKSVHMYKGCQIIAKFKWKYLNGYLENFVVFFLVALLLIIYDNVQVLFHNNKVNENWVNIINNYPV